MLKQHLIVGFLLLLTVFAAEKDYTGFVEKIKESISDPKGIFYHSTYERLAYLSDTYGPRLWGSSTLERVIQEVASMASQEGFDNVHLEAVKNFTRWERGT